MKIVENRISDYVSINIVESEPMWNSSARYNYGDEIRDGHYIFKYAGDDGTNTTQRPQVDAIKQGFKWVNIRPTNYYAMLDSKTATQTTKSEELNFKLHNRGYDTLSLMNVEANEIKIELLAPDDQVLFQKEESLRDEKEIIDFYTYCYSPILRKETFYTGDIPIIMGTTLSVSLSSKSGDVKCGRLVFGDSFFVGCTNAEFSLGIESYSKKETDVFGNTSLVHRGARLNDSYSVSISSSSLPMLRRKFVSWDAKELLFIGDESPNSKLENLLNFGYYEDVSFEYEGGDISTLNISIKGLI